MFRSKVSGLAWLWILVGILFSQTQARLAFPQRIIFAQRIPFEPVVHKNSPQIGMALKIDPEKVVDFPFQPVGILPEFCQRGDPKLLLGEPCLNAQPPVLGQRIEMIDHLEAWLLTQIIHASQVQEEAVLVRLAAQKLYEGEKRVLLDDDDLVAKVGEGFFDLTRKLLPEQV